MLAGNSSSIPPAKYFTEASLPFSVHDDMMHNAWAEKSRLDATRRLTYAAPDKKPAFGKLRVQARGTAMGLLWNGGYHQDTSRGRI